MTTHYVRGTVLATARLLQETLMTAQCVIRRPTVYTYRPGAGDTPTLGRTVYTGRVRVQKAGLAPTQPISGGEHLEQQAYVCAVPWDTVGVRRGDEVTITTSADPDLEGRLVVTEIEANTVCLTARRFFAVRPHTEVP